MIQVKFYEAVEDILLKFAVIISKHNGQWVMCRHKDRDTYEIPGGHREQGETIEEAARRELKEETGAVDFTLEPVCVYSVTGRTRVVDDEKETFGMLYFSDITTFEKELHSEIEQIKLFDALPEHWTYPMIQPILLQEYERRKT